MDHWPAGQQVWQGCRRCAASKAYSANCRLGFHVFLYTSLLTCCNAKLCQCLNLLDIINSHVLLPLPAGHTYQQHMVCMGLVLAASHNIMRQLNSSCVWLPQSSSWRWHPFGHCYKSPACCCADHCWQLLAVCNAMSNSLLPNNSSLKSCFCSHCVRALHSCG